MGPRRFKFMVWFLFLFPLVLFWGWFGFLLDNLFYRSYLRQKINKPLFLIGNFRSGTTLLQRIIAKDEVNFSAMQSWEIFVVPSISLRRFFHGLSAVDNLIGKPLKRFLFGWERRVIRSLKKHSAGIKEYEEDEGVFLFLWAGLVRWTFYPRRVNSEKFLFFDSAVPRWYRKRLMNFYTRIIRRHLYLRKGRHYLSKNPASTTKIASILEAMPQARFVYIVRNPYDTIASNFDFFRYAWSQVDEVDESCPNSDFLLEMIKTFYDYPLKALAKLPEDRYIIVRFDDLVANPKETVLGIYNKLGYEAGENFLRQLDEEVIIARAHKSSRKLLLSDLGLDQRMVEEAFQDVFTRHGFQHRGI